MSIHELIKNGIPEALKAHEEARLRTLRSLATAMTNEVVAKKRKPNEFLSDDDALAVLKRAANQRKDSIEQFEKGGRPELTVPEKEELSIIESFLPAQMGAEEIETVVRAKMAEMNVTNKSDAGKLTGSVMKELGGRADGSQVKAIIDALLA
ncbi:MAG: GatB/YqeY domain-containing protein [Candidatus Pacebacteria bacterium]|nr:GatB/YqeY domain-containing protein [Candidatus Paceibacterota bacterium]